MLDLVQNFVYFRRFIRLFTYLDTKFHKSRLFATISYKMGHMPMPAWKGSNKTSKETKGNRFQIIILVT